MKQPILHDSSARSVSRRRFLRVGTAGLVGTAVYGCSDAFAPPDSPGFLSPTDSPKRVVVIGAGVAGLAAAYELSRSGHDVTVLEARDRVGGRVLTLAVGSPRAHVVEAGAARIRPEHDLTLGYAEHFGLTLDPFYATSGAYVELTNDTRVLRPSAEFRAARPDFVKIRGGTDLLPQAFAEALGARVRLGQAVARVTAASGAVVVDTAGGDTLAADRALVTVPLTLLDEIDFTPPLSEAKRAAADGGFDYQAATRVFVHMRTRFWEAEGLNGWAETDWPEELWHPTWDAPGPDGVLLTYVRGDLARSLDALSAGARLETVIDHWEGVFPGVSEHVLSAHAHSWQSDPWSRAAWAAPTVAQELEHGEEIGAAEGLVHFAGEHASADRGWMQGALASGLRAATEIHEA